MNQFVCVSGDESTESPEARLREVLGGFCQAAAIAIDCLRTRFNLNNQERSHLLKNALEAALCDNSVRSNDNASSHQQQLEDKLTRLIELLPCPTVCLLPQETLAGNEDVTEISSAGPIQESALQQEEDLMIGLRDSPDTARAHVHDELGIPATTPARLDESSRTGPAEDHESSLSKGIRVHPRRGQITQPRLKAGIAPESGLRLKFIKNTSGSDELTLVPGGQGSAPKVPRKRKHKLLEQRAFKKPKGRQDLSNWHDHVELRQDFCKVLTQIERIIPPSHSDFFARLYISIGSGTAIRQLRASCIYMQEEGRNLDTANAGSLVSFLLDLDANDFRTDILRRYSMARLLQLRQAAAREKHCLCCEMCQAAQSNKISYQANSWTPELSLKAGRPRCRALNVLQDMLLPSRELKAQRRKLVEALSRGRAWHAFSKRFGIGILALIPSQETYNITSNSIQSAFDVAHFNGFLSILESHRGQVLSKAALSVYHIFDLLLGAGVETKWNFEKSDCLRIEDENIDSKFVLLCARQS